MIHVLLSYSENGVEGGDPAVLRPHCCSLCAASLSGCCIGDANAKVLAGHLKNNKYLTVLR